MLMPHTAPALSRLCGIFTCGNELPMDGWDDEELYEAIANLSSLVESSCLAGKHA